MKLWQMNIFLNRKDNVSYIYLRKQDISYSLYVCVKILLYLCVSQVGQLTIFMHTGRLYPITYKSKLKKKKIRYFS